MHLNLPQNHSKFFYDHYLIIYMRRIIFFITLVLSLNIYLNAHQGYGIVMDQYGNIYFTDIHRQTIWKIDKNNDLTPLAREKWSHQLWMENDGSLFFTNEEEISGKQGYSLWRLDNSKLEQIIPPTLRPDFPNDIFIINAEGILYVADNTQIYSKNAAEKFEVLNLYQKKSPEEKAILKGIRAITRGPDGAIYLTDRDAVKKIDKWEVETIAVNLISANPTNIPIKNAPNPESINRLFGLTIDKDSNVYAAYFGNSQILKISNKGNVSVFYDSEPPWSPVGVTIDFEDLIIKEHAFIENKGWIGPRIIRLSSEGKKETLIELKD